MPGNGSLQQMLDPTAPVPSSSAIPYAPTNRSTEAYSVLQPISRLESVQCDSTANTLRRFPKSIHHEQKKKKEEVVVVVDQRVASESRLTGLAGLPKRPGQPNGGDSNGHGNGTSGNDHGKRRREEEERGASEREREDKIRRTSQDVNAVQFHYNARPNIDRDARNLSPIIGLKNFNNWIKSVLIAKFGRREAERDLPKLKVLDLGCGKGGDLQKWSRAGTDEYIGIDLAAVSVEQARARWEEMRENQRFQAAFFALDCFERSISEVLQDVHVERPFDVVSMQFCLHYAFETEAKARRMLENVSKYLRDGGVLIATIPTSYNLLDRLAQLPPDQLEFGNSVYKIQFDEQDPTPRFGHRYTFTLEDAVEAVPEYVVYQDELMILAEQYGLECTFQAEFQMIFQEEKADRHFAQLLTRMKVVDMNGDTEMTSDQWEAVNLYSGIVFTKR